MTTFGWNERSDGIGYLRPTIDGLPVDPLVGTWQWLIKPHASPALDDDTTALLSVTSTPNANGTVLTVIDDPDNPGTDIWQVTVNIADMPAPGYYKHRLDRTSSPVQRFTPQALRIFDV